MSPAYLLLRLDVDTRLRILANHGLALAILRKKVTQVLVVDLHVEWQGRRNAGGRMGGVRWRIGVRVRV
jgi:hypothetical protein